MGRKEIRDYNTEGIHTNVSFIIGIIAMLIMGYIGIKYIGAEADYDKSFGKWAFIHTFYCFCGLFIAPVISGNSIVPQKKFSFDSFKHFLIIFLSTAWFQFFISMLSVSGTDRKLYHIFSAVSEELFFRAFLIPVIIRMLPFEKILYSKIIAVIISGSMFAFGHVNYWNDPISMLSVLGAGLIFGAFYAFWNDITANSGAHMLNNIIATGVFSA